jgi:hypothetical protein
MQFRNVLCIFLTLWIKFGTGDIRSNLMRHFARKFSENGAGKGIYSGT